jgi:hypothetical protein
VIGVGLNPRTFCPSRERPPYLAGGLAAVAGVRRAKHLVSRPTRSGISTTSRQYFPIECASLPRTEERRVRTGRDRVDGIRSCMAPSDRAAAGRAGDTPTRPGRRGGASVTAGGGQSGAAWRPGAVLRSLGASLSTGMARAALRHLGRIRNFARGAVALPDRCQCRRTRDEAVAHGDAQDPRRP